MVVCTVGVGVDGLVMLDYARYQLVGIGWTCCR